MIAPKNDTIGECWTKHMECKFPFKDEDGQLHNECTSARICTAENCNDVDFLWCATKVDVSGKMKYWGKCEDNPIYNCGA